MDENPLDTAKRLVRAVGRAFYSDEVVVMLEMLLRDRYLRDSTMDKRVGISAKLVSKPR
jgi:transcription initiation factor IIE alpha subunit